MHTYECLVPRISPITTLEAAVKHISSANVIPIAVPTVDSGTVRVIHAITLTYRSGERDGYQSNNSNKSIGDQ